MHIDKLRLVGFKSFVEATDLVIETGLTGVVGPNGCGKSNLLEALRWVMGETSYKSMRAAAMDDVIFSGTSGRPARNSAEVTIFLDNAARQAPAEYNDVEQIEITRRIEREAGSVYRINGRDARARDVKILFEDAATGARSPALVRQGQIGDIVNAKPEQRRRILEDAAGIAGLHSRRHEAELRLKGAENNLARLGDIIGQLKSQLDGLKRQARQARRYSDLTDQIRSAEAIVLHLTWLEAQGQVASEEAALQEALQHLGVATQAEAKAIRVEAELGESLQPLREQEMIRAAVVARLGHEQAALASEAERIDGRRQELAQQLERVADDRTREQTLIDEAGRQTTRYREELDALNQSDSGSGSSEESIRAKITDAERALAEADAAHDGVRARLEELQRERSRLTAQQNERQTRFGRLEQRIAELAAQMLQAEGQLPDETQRNDVSQTCESLAATLGACETAIAQAEAATREATQAQQTAANERQTQELALRSLEAEQAALAGLVRSDDTEFAPVVDSITVAAGYELALTAALGDDIEAAVDPAAAIYWSEVTNGPDDPSLPAGAVPISDHVTAPDVLARRLKQIGVVDATDGPKLAKALSPGQRLVTRDGHLWRWDGFVARPDAPSRTAQLLAARNRLSEIELQLDTAKLQAETANSAANEADRYLESAREHEHELRQQQRRDQAELNRARDAWAAFERASRDAMARLDALRSTHEQATTERHEAKQELETASAAVAALADSAELETEVTARSEELRQVRDLLAGHRAELGNLVREQERLVARRKALDEEIASWSRRATDAKARLGVIAERQSALESELAGLAERPEELARQRAELAGRIETAEDERKAAADKVAETETALREAAAELRKCTAQVTDCREERARAEARLEGARQKRAGVAQHIEDTLQTTPEGCLEIAGMTPDATLPNLADAESRLARLRADRERLGGVNLQAEQELSEIETQHDGLEQERADVEEAIAKLRGGIASLNREGRKRLNEAFHTVDAHFRALFETLFGGGEARLEMIESEEDPLAGGLEIIAKPPGKKPTTLSLLSGGEQTLTALSLIFAVFLTNPSPICVLDEVDAPLDDANVDRFCRMMEKMSEDTDTRFLVITHHPMTMARMDRLFGVTMGEKGVSQLVSVDLNVAEAFLEAGE